MKLENKKNSTSWHRVSKTARLVVSPMVRGLELYFLSMTDNITGLNLIDITEFKQVTLCH